MRASDSLDGCVRHISAAKRQALVNRRPLIHFSNSPGTAIGTAPPPCFFAAPGAPSLSLPSGCEGMARQGALPSSVQYPHLLAKMRKRLPARHPDIIENARAHLRSSSFRFAHSRKRTYGAGPRFSCSRRKPAGPFLPCAGPL